jgi:predicted DNA-binding transcriptional regulator YafY
VIAGTASLPPVNFTISQAIAAAAALAAMPDGSPFGTDARAAAGKIRDALSPSDALKSSETARRLWVHTKTHTGAASRSVRAIEQSLLQSNVVLLTYRAADGTTTRRAVEPTILALTEGHWYLVAHCRLVDDLRWFRFDRIITADLTREPYTPRPVADIGTAPEGAHHVDTSEEGPIHDVNGR